VASPNKEFILKIKNFAAGAAMVGALGLGAIGLGSGVVNAKPNPGPPIPPIPVPGYDAWLPGDPPGHNPFGPPGQVKKQETINGVPNPFYGEPPGHWDDVPLEYWGDVPQERWNDPGFFGLPAVFLPPDIRGVTAPLPVVFNPATAAWGVFVNPNWFIPLP
jgi:hypothetical protein